MPDINLFLNLEKALQNSSDDAKKAADHAEHCEECGLDFTKDPAGEILHPCAVYQSLIEDWKEASGQTSLLFKQIHEGLTGHAQAQ